MALSTPVSGGTYALALMPKRAIAYIDSHNLYRGTVSKEPSLKWLDLFRFCDALLGRHGALAAVKYYTARVIDFPNDPQQSQRQDIYLQALAATGRIEIVEGRFARRKKRVLLRSGLTETGRVYEEKGTDVNLAADLVHDAHKRDAEVALIVSNDSDLSRAIDHARSEGMTVIGVNPHRRTHRRPALRNVDISVHIRRWHLARHQLPEEVMAADGTVLHRPASWS